MKLEFWGTRGSIAVPSGKTPKGDKRQTYKYGGNSTCMRIVSDVGSQHIIDAGTGIKNLGDYLENKYSKTGLKIDIYFTHTHWDHIQGLPFFKPAYDPKFDITLHAQLKDRYDLGASANKNMSKAIGIRHIITEQHESSNFPAPPSALKGIKKYVDFKPRDIVKDDDLIIDTLAVSHPGGCIAYKFSEVNKKNDSDKKFKSIIISTDFEISGDPSDTKLKSFITDADIWVADGQYEKDSEINRHIKGCGHSDPFEMVDYAIECDVSILIITHHSPKMDDKYHSDLEKRLKKYAQDTSLKEKKKCPKVFLAKEGDSYTI